MAATTNIERTIGATGSPTTINVTSSGLLWTLDDLNNGTNAVAIPQAGGVVNASYAAAIALRVSAGTGSAISNKRLYYSGSLPTGFGIFMQVEASTPATSTTYARGGAVVCTGTTVAGAAIANVTVNGSGTAASGFVAMGSSTSGTVFDSSSITVPNASSALGSKYCFVIGVVDSTATTTGNVTMPSLILLYDEQ